MMSWMALAWSATLPVSVPVPVLEPPVVVVRVGVGSVVPVVTDMLEQC